PPGRGDRQGPQVRIPPAERAGPPVHQRTEVHTFVTPSQPHWQGPRVPEAPAPRQQAAQYCLPAQRIVWPTVGLSQPERSASVLRQLAPRVEMAAAQTV